MKRIKQICFWVALAQILVACTTPAIPMANSIVPSATLTVVANFPSVATEARTQTLVRSSSPSPKPTASPSETPTSSNTTNPSSIADPTPTCPSNAEGWRGLYVISIEPIPSLVWDLTPRQFRIGVCKTLAESLVIDSRFRLLVFSPTVKNPIGQTSDLPAQLTPGLHELVFGSWTPGLQNHVSACIDLRTVEVLVEYNDFPAANNFRPVLWPDGSIRKVFPIACGGNYP